MVKKFNIFSCTAIVACLCLTSQDADAGGKRVKYLELAQSNGQGYLNLGKNFLDAYEALLAPDARAATRVRVARRQGSARTINIPNTIEAGIRAYGLFPKTDPR